MSRWKWLGIGLIVVVGSFAGFVIYQINTYGLR